MSEGNLSQQADFKALQDRLLSIYSSKERFRRPSIENGNVRNFWTDGDHQRGIWRQTTLAEYKKPEPKWTTLLDIDALNKAENESYVFHGADCLYPQEKKCLVRLSKGGGDADIVREFDVGQRRSSCRTASCSPRRRARSTGRTRTPSTSARTSAPDR